MIRIASVTLVLGALYVQGCVSDDYPARGSLGVDGTFLENYAVRDENPDETLDPEMIDGTYYDCIPRQNGDKVRFYCALIVPGGELWEGNAFIEQVELIGPSLRESVKTERPEKGRKHHLEFETSVTSAKALESIRSTNKAEFRPRKF